MLFRNAVRRRIHRVRQRSQPTASAAAHCAAESPRNLISQETSQGGDKNRLRRPLPRVSPLTDGHARDCTAAGEDPAQLPGRRVRRTDGHTRDCTVCTLVSDRSVLGSRRRQPLPPLARQSRGLAAPLLPQAECAARQVVISCRDNCAMPLAVEQYPSLRRRSTREARRGRAECG